MGTHVPTNGLMPRARVLSPILRDGRKKKHGRISMLATMGSRAKTDLQPQRGARVMTRPTYFLDEDSMVPLTVQVLLWAKGVQGTSSRTRPVDLCSWSQLPHGTLAWFIFIGDKVVLASKRFDLQN